MTAGPAVVASTAFGSIEVDCVSVNPDGSFTAVLGYTNSSGAQITISAGAANSVTPAALDGEQTTVFDTGYHPGAWQSTAEPGTASVTWSLSSHRDNGGGQGVDKGHGKMVNVTATSSDPTCGSGSTSLPADGNEMAAPIVVAAAVPVAVAVRSRRRRRSRTC